MGRERASRRWRLFQGTTLVEILLAAGLLSLLAVALLDAFTVTQRRASAGEAQLNSGILAQLVTERFRSNLTLNPRYLRDLLGASSSWTFIGTVVDPASAVNPDKLQLSPFFEYLFPRGCPDLWASANQIPIAPALSVTPAGLKPRELTSLLDAFRDYQVKVEIADDVDLDSPGAPTALSEQVKRITVTVSRSSVVAAKGADPLAYTVTTRVLSPCDSLSTAALDLFYQHFEGPALSVLWDGFFLIAGDNSYFSPAVFKLSDRRLLADVFLILAGANSEALVVDGECVPESVIVDASKDAQFIESWIRQMSAPNVIGLSSSKRALVHLKSQKASVIFDTFKKIRLPLEHFNSEILGPLSGRQCLLERVRSLSASMTSLLTQADAAQAGAAAAALAPPAVKAAAEAKYAESVAAGTDFIVQNAAPTLISSFIAQFFTDPDYTSIARRPVQYAARFRATLDDLEGTLISHLDQTEGVTGYERTRTAQIYLEVTMARQLVSDAPDGAALARLKTLASQHALRLAPLSSYLAGGEVHEMVQLRERNVCFATRVAQLKQDCPRFGQVRELFLPRGEISEYLSLCETFTERHKAKIDLSKLTALLGK